MAFALTKYESRCIEIGSPSMKRGIQQVVLDITGEAADVDLDIGDPAGTFWGDVDATALGVSALDNLTRVAAQASALVAVQSEQLIDRVQVGTPSGAGEYSLAIGDIGPNIAFNAADGEESYKIILVWEMDNFIAPLNLLLGQ